MDETRQTGDEQNWTNPGEFGWNRRNGAKWGKNRQKTGIFRQKRGKKRAKSGKGKIRVDKTEPWQNRAKPKVSPKLGSGLVIPGMARYSSQLLPPAEVFGLRARLFLPFEFSLQAVFGGHSRRHHRHRPVDWASDSWRNRLLLIIPTCLYI